MGDASKSIKIDLECLSPENKHRETGYLLRIYNPPPPNCITNEVIEVAAWVPFFSLPPGYYSTAKDKPSFIVHILKPIGSH